MPPVRRVALLMLCGACGFTGRPIADPDAQIDGAIPDAAIDAGADAAVDTIDFLPSAEESIGTMDWTVGNATMIDTTTLVVTPPAPLGITLVEARQDNGGTIAILRVKELTISNRIYAYGEKPIAILAERVTISGTLDVGAHLAQRGSGGALGALGTGAGKTSVHDNGTGSGYDDSGGGGGSFGTAGGSGGAAGPFAGGAGGPTYAIEGLVGGSGGGAAGACANLAGAGGGAVLIYATVQIRIAARSPRAAEVARAASWRARRARAREQAVARAA